MLWLDEKYSKMLPLAGFELKSASGRYHANFRCPLCGDSKKSQKLKRGWFERNRDGLTFRCYNCGRAMQFRTLLREYFPEDYKTYLTELFKNGGVHSALAKDISNKPRAVPAALLHTVTDLKMQKVVDLPTDHPAQVYLRNRKLSGPKVDDYFYTDNFYEWVHERDSNKCTSGKSWDPRIVIPFRNIEGDITMVSARTIEDSSLRYMHFKFDEDSDKVYGLNFVDETKDIYVLEGPIDTAYLKNAVAMAGGVGGLQKLEHYFNKDSLIIVADNEPRNKYTCQFMHKALNAGLRIVLWPTSWKYKDIGEAVESGVACDVIEDVLHTNTVGGLEGTIKFKLWRKS